MRSLRAAFALVLWMTVFGFTATGRADKPPKIPVAFGKWTGPHASHFKSALRSAATKECAVVSASKARVIVDGEVTEKEDKHLSVRVLVKSPKTNELVESKEYVLAKPDVSKGQARKMGHDLFEIARRAPE
jgi:hypothetical protein